MAVGGLVFETADRAEARLVKPRAGLCSKKHLLRDLVRNTPTRFHLEVCAADLLGCAEAKAEEPETVLRIADKDGLGYRGRGTASRGSDRSSAGDGTPSRIPVHLRPLLRQARQAARAPKRKQQNLLLPQDVMTLYGPVTTPGGYSEGTTNGR
ncbi:hypothetical protein CDD83_6210 [Cordyceps sp. RAO-2017]|nr:hypothetical protein CDD83_6210 [Cordyceps sp. RAO-2017]